MVFITNVCMSYMPRWLRRIPTYNPWFRKQALFRLTQFYYGRNRNCWRVAMNKWTKTQVKDEKKRRDKIQLFRDLFSQRILAAVEEQQFDYYHFMESLAKCDIQLNRKALSCIALYEPRTFKCLVDIAKAKYCNDGKTEAARHAKPPLNVNTRGML